jgi:hypothetical protein
LPPSQRRPESNLSPDIDRVILKALDKNSSRRHLTLRLFLTEVEGLTPPGAAAAPAASAGNRDVGFAKTMLFAGGQAEVASLVAKAIAARTGGTHATPAGGSPATGHPAAAAAHAAAPVAAAAHATAPSSASVASTVLAGGGNGHEAGASGHVARLTPPPVTPYAGSPITAAAAPPAAAAAGSPTPAAGVPTKDDGKGGVKPAFRETLWFKRGDVDQMVAEAKAKMAGRPEAAAEVPEDVRPLEDRYVDDGTVTTEDRKKFSLRSGGTATAMPSAGARLPGAGMSEKEVIEEIAGPRRTLILVVLAVVVAAVIVVVFMLMRSRGADRAELPSPPPTTAAVPAPAPTPPAAAIPRPAPAPAATAAAPAAAVPAVRTPPPPAAKPADTTPTTTVAKEEADPEAPAARGDTPTRKKASRHRRHRAKTP